MLALWVRYNSYRRQRGIDSGDNMYARIPTYYYGTGYGVIDTEPATLSVINSTTVSCGEGLGQSCST